jgi:hypothetical protein
MSGNEEFDREVEDLTERYLLFLRGQGPEPDLGHLSATRRRAVRARLDTVDALFGLDPNPPALEDDPVAIALGLVPDPDAKDPASGGSGDSGREPGTGSAAIDTSAPSSAADDDAGRQQSHRAARRVLEELEALFHGQVTVDWQPAWAGARINALEPLAECSVLGDAMALFVADEMPEESSDAKSHGDAVGESGVLIGNRVEGTNSPDSDERAGEDWEIAQLALFLRRHPEVSAVGLVARDGSGAAILPAAACHRSIDPVRGWLKPGAFVISEAFDLTLARYFEQRLPRWERVAGLADVLALGDDEEHTQRIVHDEFAAALVARPRLAHKKDAQQALRQIDPLAVASLISAAQSGSLDAGQMVDQLVSIAEDSV